MTKKKAPDAGARRSTIDPYDPAAAEPAVSLPIHLHLLIWRKFVESFGEKYISVSEMMGNDGE